jgi:autotransporter translocation and assembly factor TamB
MTGVFRFGGDSIVTERLTVQGKDGDLTVTGGVRLEELTRPVLGLTISAREFDLIDVDDYLKIRATGDVRLTGTPVRPVLTGIGRVTRSVVFFADLITKNIVNLEDPLNADLVDTLLLREQKLGASFQSRFLDSLSIRNLDFIIGDDVWLRSNEANFQLEGRLRVNKTRKIYRMDGSLDTPRGTYTLKAGGLINRTFTVERGTVRYYGDLNADLDVQARHVVKTPQGSSNDIPVIAHITGTLQVPKLELTSAPDRPPMSEPELISLLMLGTIDPAAGAQLGTDQQKVTAAGALALSGLTTELQRALTSNFNGILEIRPGIASSGLTNISSSATQVAVGRAITSKLFITANAGFCFSNASTLSAKNLGASLEYRFRRELRLVLSAEPLQTCFATGSDAFLTNKRYQFGAELRWDRDY